MILLKADKFSKYLLIVCLVCAVSSLFAQKISWSQGEADLREIIDYLEDEHNFLFSYNPADLENQRLNPPSQAPDIEVFLTKTLTPAPLKFEIINRNYVILSRKKKEEISEVSKPLQSICGTVRDHLSGEPLAFANVYLENTTLGTNTDADGNFNLQADFTDSPELIVSYIGYQKSSTDLSVLPTECLDLDLEYLSYDENMVVVREYLTDGISLRNQGEYTEIQPEVSGILPGQAETDVLQSIQFLPGINSPDGTAGNLNIRGSTSDQNLILWENMPVYHAAHYFGMISAFNPFITNRVRVWRGGFGARYGGRIGGVIDMSSPDKVEEPEFGVGLNGLSLYTYGSLPLAEDKITLSFSMRRSYADVWQTPAFNNFTQRIHQGVLLQIPTGNSIPDNIRISSKFLFFDTNAKLSYRISDRSQVSLAAIYAHNDFTSSTDDTNVERTLRDSFFLDNLGLSLQWKQRWSERWSSDFSIAFTDFNKDYSYLLLRRNNIPNRQGVKNNSIEETRATAVTQYALPKGHRFSFGWEMSKYKVDYLITNVEGSLSGSSGEIIPASSINSVFANFAHKKDSRTGIEVGVRFTDFDRSDKLYFAPRFRFWHRLRPALTFSATAGRYFQYISQLTDIQVNAIGIETPIWVLGGTDNVPVLKSDQAQLGLLFQKNRWRIDAQFYMKENSGQTSLATGFSDDFESRFNIGTNFIKGFDLLVKKKWNNYQSWISYAWMDAESRFPTFFDEVFPAVNEISHSLRWVNSRTVGNFTAGLGFRIASGLPYSDLRNFVINNDSDDPEMPDFELRPQINQFNDQKLPFTRQMDVSFSYEIPAKNKKNPNWHLGLSVFNLFNYRNVYNRSLFIERKNQEPNIVYLNRADLGFTFNFSVRAEW